MKNALRVFSIISSGLLTVACGNAYTGATIAVQAGGSNTTSTGSSGSSLSSTSDIGTSLVAPFVFSIQGTGYNPVTLTVKTGSVLKVTFAPGQQTKEVTGTSYVYQYSKLGVYIMAGTETTAQPTAMLSNGLLGNSAESSTVMDLSSGIPSGCTGDPCRVEVTITIEQPNSDGECLAGNLLACPWAHVPSNVPWNGTLNVQTDDTTSL